MAGLEGGTVAGGVDVEAGDCGQDGVGVDTVTSGIAIDAGGEVLAVPVGCLEEAEDLGGLCASGARDTESLCQLGTLDEGSILSVGGEEARDGDLLPEIEAS